MFIVISISSFISPNSFSKFFINTSSSRLTFESTKALEIKISTLFNLEFANDNILSCFFIFFLILDLCFLVSAVTTQITNTIAELVIPIEIPTKKNKSSNGNASINGRR